MVKTVEYACILQRGMLYFGERSMEYWLLVLLLTSTYYRCLLLRRPPYSYPVNTRAIDLKKQWNSLAIMPDTFVCSTWSPYQLSLPGLSCSWLVAPETETHRARTQTDTQANLILLDCLERKTEIVIESQILTLEPWRNVRFSIHPGDLPKPCERESFLGVGGGFSCVKSLVYVFFLFYHGSRISFFLFLLFLSY